MVNKDFCMSSYMAFRYIEKDDMEFYEGLKHQNFIPPSDNERILVKTADDIDREIGKQIDRFADKKKGIL